MKSILISSLLSIAALSSSMAAQADTSNVACYFDDRATITWRWGLKENNSWYEVSGDWKKTEYTKATKFFSKTKPAAVKAACVKAKKYYKENGQLLAIFAATSSVGHNYPMVLNGTEVYPDY